jgi:hypothetical protein
MMKTIRKVTRFVMVLMTSCHVSEKWNSGPVNTHRSTTATDDMKAVDEPSQTEADWASRRKSSLMDLLLGRHFTSRRKESRSSHVAR